MTTTNMCSNFGGFRCSPPLLKIVIESPEKLTNSDLEEIVDVWNRKGRRIAVYTLIQILISLQMHCSCTWSSTYQHQ